MRVEWLKLDANLMGNRKIKRIRSEENGDLMVLTWIYMLLVAAGLNDGGRIYFCNGQPYTPAELAEDIGIDAKIVTRAIELFQKYQMIDADFTILNWEKYQNLEGLERIREQNRKRQQDFKNRRNTKDSEKVTLDNVTDNVTVTLGNVTDKKRREEIRREEKRKDIVAEQALQIISHLNEVCGSHYKSNAKGTLKHITARLNEGYLLEEFYAVIDKKWREWSGTDMERYMRPETLFNSEHFESYLNQPDAPKQKPKKGGQPSNNVDWDSLV